MAKYTTRTQEIRTLQDYHSAQKSLAAGFITKKLALAAQALVDSGMSKNQVARALDLPKDTDVYNLISFLKRGSNA